jgi:hypothetical protein
MDVEASNAGATSVDAVAPPMTSGTVDGSGSPEAPAATEAAASSQTAATSEAPATATAEAATAIDEAAPATTVTAIAVAAPAVGFCCFTAARKQRIKDKEGFATCLLVFSNLVEAMMEARFRGGSTVLIDKVLTHVNLDII